MKHNFQALYLTLVRGFISIVLSSLAGLFVSSIVAEIITFCGISFRGLLIIYGIVFAGVLPVVYRTLQKSIEHTPSYRRCLGFLILMGTFFFLYAKPNEVIVGGQDPSVYYAKAISIVDHDTIHKPLPSWSLLTEKQIEESGIKEVLGRYNFLFNGIVPTIENGKYILKSDFIIGPVISNVILGILNRESLLYGSVFVCFLSFFTLFFLLKVWLSETYAFWGTMLLMLNPAQIFFGLSTFSEVPSQLCIISSILALWIGEKYQSRLYSIFGLIAALASLTVRLDNAIFVSAILVWWSLLSKDKSKVLALITLSLGSVIIVLVMSQNHSIYMTRIYAGTGWIRFENYIFIATPLLVTIFRSPLLKLYEIIVQSLDKVSQWVLILFGLSVFSYLYFIRPEIEPFHEKMMFGKMMRTYRENTLLNLSYLMGIPILLLFFCNLLGFIKKAVNVRRKESTWIFAGMVFLYGVILLYDNAASPQMYWSLRRFLPILIPGIILIALDQITLLPYSVVRGSLIIVLFGVQLQILYLTEIGTEMRGSVNSVEIFNNDFKSNNVIFADKSFRHILFSLVYGGNNEVVPLKDNASAGVELLNSIGISRSIQIREVASKEYNYLFRYERVGENYEKIPVKKYMINRYFEVNGGIVRP